MLLPEHPRHYICYRARKPLRIDGKLDDPAWQDAEWTEEFVDIEGEKKPRPRFRTRAKMLWDDRYFPGLKTAVHIDGTLNDPRDIDRGWSVEIAIPWVVLAEYAGCPAPPRDGDQWRVNFSRVEWLVRVVNGKYEKVPNTPEDNWVWSPQGVIDMHRPETWGYVQFSTAQPGKARFHPDVTYPVRMDLMRLYYAQQAFRQKHNRWAGSLQELGWQPSLPEGCELPVLQTVGDGYTASIRCRFADGRVRTVTVRHDSRLWVD